MVREAGGSAPPVVDWTHPVIVQCIWDHLGTLEGLWCADVPPGCAAYLCVVIGRLCWSTRDAQRVLRLLQALGRPYLLSHPVFSVDLSVTVAYELAVRRFVLLVETLAHKESLGPVAVAGGFAAWQLDRATQASCGRDAFPRCDTNDSHLWIPGDLDVFVSSQDFGAIESIVSYALLRLLEEVSSPLAPRHLWYDCVCNDYGEEASEGEEEEEEELSSIEDAACVVERLMASEVLGSIAAERVRSDLAPHLLTRTDSRSNTIRNCSLRSMGLTHVWRLGSCVLRNLPTSITDINVVHTCTPPSAMLTPVAYADWVTERFDLVHCAVAVHVDAATGAWRFACRPGAAEALTSRRIHFGPHALGTVRDAARTVARIDKYMHRGFYFAG